MNEDILIDLGAVSEETKGLGGETTEDEQNHQRNP